MAVVIVRASKKEASYLRPPDSWKFSQKRKHPIKHGFWSPYGLGPENNNVGSLDPSVCLVWPPSQGVTCEPEYRVLFIRRPMLGSFSSRYTLSCFCLQVQGKSEVEF